ncbi:hypothetical protein D3C78_1952820 [compost metagenome]
MFMSCPFPHTSSEMFTIPRALRINQLAHIYKISRYPNAASYKLETLKILNSCEA